MLSDNRQFEYGRTDPQRALLAAHSHDPSLNRDARALLLGECLRFLDGRSRIEIEDALDLGEKSLVDRKIVPLDGIYRTGPKFIVTAEGQLVGFMADRGGQRNELAKGTAQILVENVNKPNRTEITSLRTIIRNWLRQEEPFTGKVDVAPLAKTFFETHSKVLTWATRPPVTPRVSNILGKAVLACSLFVGAQHFRPSTAEASAPIVFRTVSGKLVSVPESSTRVMKILDAFPNPTIKENVHDIMKNIRTFASPEEYGEALQAHAILELCEYREQLTAKVAKDGGNGDSKDIARIARTDFALHQIREIVEAEVDPKGVLTMYQLCSAKKLGMLPAKTSVVIFTHDRARNVVIKDFEPCQKRGSDRDWVDIDVMPSKENPHAEPEHVLLWGGQHRVIALDAPNRTPDDQSQVSEVFTAAHLISSATAYVNSMPMAPDELLKLCKRLEYKGFDFRDLRNRGEIIAVEGLLKRYEGSGDPTELRTAYLTCQSSLRRSGDLRFENDDQQRSNDRFQIDLCVRLLAIADFTYFEDGTSHLYTQLFKQVASLKPIISNDVHNELRFALAVRIAHAGEPDNEMTAMINDVEAELQKDTKEVYHSNRDFRLRVLQAIRELRSNQKQQVVKPISLIYYNKHSFDDKPSTIKHAVEALSAHQCNLPDVSCASIASFFENKPHYELINWSHFSRGVLFSGSFDSFEGLGRFLVLSEPDVAKRTAHEFEKRKKQIDDERKKKK